MYAPIISQGIKKGSGHCLSGLTVNQGKIEKVNPCVSIRICCLSQKGNVVTARLFTCHFEIRLPVIVFSNTYAISRLVV